MNSTHLDQSATSVSRREAVRRLAIVGTGLTVGLSTGCTPVRIGLGVYPRSYDTNPEIRDRVLRAFAATVIPGVEETAPDLIRVFEDDYYPLARYTGYFVCDLCERSSRLFDMKLFSDLKPDQRVAVVQRALSSHKVVRQLYEGAIFLTQISCYAGIYDDRKGCELIDFHGASGFVPLADQTYPSQERYLASSLTADGNYA